MKRAALKICPLCKALLKISALAVGLLLCVQAWGDYPYVLNFNKSVYKAGTQNWDIVQNDGGLMYFANNAGLLEFDGYRWESHPVDNHTNVRSVFFDGEEGRLYVGAFAEFGCFDVGEQGVLGYHPLTEPFTDIKDMAEIWKIHKIGQTFLLRDDSRIYEYNDGKVRVIDANAKINCSAVIDGILYVSCLDRGILRLKDGELEQTGWGSAFQGKKVCAIMPFQGNRIIVATEFDGLYLYSGRSVGKVELGTTEEKIRSGQVFCAATDGNRIAVGTVTDGIFILTPGRTDKNVHLNTHSGLQNNSVLSLHFDRRGNLWAGLDRGIDYIDTHSAVTSLLGSSQMVGTGYTSIIHNGRLYLGTNQGLYYMNAGDTHAPEAQVRSVQGISGQVWSLSEIDGDLLCGHDGGLYEVYDSGVRQVEGLDGIWNVVEYNDNRNLALGCSYSGLFFIEKRNGHWRLRNFLNGFSESSTVFVVDNDGKIWLHHWMKGLFRLTLDERLENVVKVEYFDKDSGFPTDRNNIVNKCGGKVVFSSEGGFYEYDEAVGRMRPAGSLNGLFDIPPIAVRIHESPYGDLVFLSESTQTIAMKGADTWRLDSLSMRSVREERIPGFDNVNWLDRNSFIINTEDGFSIVDLNKGGDDSFDGRLVIKRVNRTGRRHSSLEFEFAAPKYNAQEEVEYSCFLEHYDADWSEWSPSNTRSYTKLPGGNFTLYVRARIPSGEMSETSFGFSIPSPWYFSTVAICVYVLLLILLALGVVKFFDFRMHRQAEAKDLEINQLLTRNAEDELKHKSQELANSTMNLIRKNNILIKIRNNLDKISTDISATGKDSDAMKRIQRIRADIAENLGHDEDWKKFSENFDVVYEDYLKRLKRDFPSLTVRDLRLCSYLKMGLSSKEIATMLNMMVRSVEMARYRLKQKLCLKHDANLTIFLQGL